MSDKIKVVGYAQRIFFDNGIEYRNFTDDLVGNQLTENSDGESSILTFGNFVTTTNFRGRASRLYSTKKFSKFYSLDNLGVTSDKLTSLLNNNINVTLNLDKTDLCNFAYFGSSTEFIRVNLENIITKWPASIFLSPIRDTETTSVSGNTIENYLYDFNLNTSTFRVPTNFIVNNYNINYRTNGSTIDTFNEENDLRNLTVNYLDYVIFVNDVEYNVLGFTGSTNGFNDYIYFEVKGDPFTQFITDLIEYHVKPNKEILEEFFNTLSDFESNLLNRLTTPQYTSNYKFKVESDTGRIINSFKKLTWPVSDGYNIDFNSTAYISYVTDLLEITTNKDETETNLIVRFLTSEAISDFDTIPNSDGEIEETEGQKINKTLKIYGREFDEIKKYITGISYANNVSYDKKNNTPDQLIKYLARLLGWELTSSIVENNLINNYLKLGSTTYPGYSRGLSPNESEIELWRRLILNSAWIWKSKGTRKAVEFFFKLIGTPDGLINFNEYVYKAKEPIDMDLFFKVLKNNNLDEDLELYNVDSEGYPKFFRDTIDMYFQKGGKWYRETAGPTATQYVLEGNNPHVGPYDSGKEYINQLENIIPTFSAFTITSTTVTTDNSNIFTNYNNGIINQYTGPTYVDVQNEIGVDLSEVILLETNVITDPCPTAEQTDCGCDVPEDDESLIIDVEKCTNNPISINEKCQSKFDKVYIQSNDFHYMWSYKVYDINGNITTPSKVSQFVSKECCQEVGKGVSYYHEEYEQSITFDSFGNEIYSYSLINVGYLCCTKPNLDARPKGGCGCKISCQWSIVPDLPIKYINDEQYIVFIDPISNKRVVNEADSCFCPDIYTEPKLITDPFTGKQGFGCKLTKIGLNDYNTLGVKGYLYQLYLKRSRGEIPCNSEIFQISPGDTKG